MQNNNLKVVVTGAGGYIGSITTYSLLRHGHTVVAIDNFERGYHQPLEILGNQFPGKIEIREVDLLSSITPPFTKSDHIDAVMHFAAYCIVDESTKNPDKYLIDNPRMLNSVIKAMTDSMVNKIILSSTAAVYGEPEKLPVTEKTLVQPINPYGESKLLSENLLRKSAVTNALSYIIFRYFNVCGASEDGKIGDSKKPSELLVQNAVRGALGIQNFYATYSPVDTIDGSPIRDLIDVEDLASAHLLGLNYFNKNNFVSNVFNLGSEKGFSVIEVVKTVEKITKKHIHFDKGKLRLGEQARMLADAKKAAKVLNWHPKRELVDSIMSLISWYSQNPNGWTY